jgi:hypothetical protein
MREPAERAADARFALAPGVVLQDAADGAILLNLHAETIYSLNATGARAVALMAAGMAFGAAVDRLVAEYHGERSDVASATSVLAAALLDAGLLVEAGAT